MMSLFSSAEPVSEAGQTKSARMRPGRTVHAPHSSALLEAMLALTLAAALAATIMGALAS
jgi:hypothetical protein